MDNHGFSSVEGLDYHLQVRHIHDFNVLAFRHETKGLVTNLLALCVTSKPPAKVTTRRRAARSTASRRPCYSAMRHRVEVNAFASIMSQRAPRYTVLSPAVGDSLGIERVTACPARVVAHLQHQVLAIHGGRSWPWHG